MCKCTGKGSQKDINVTAGLSCASGDLYCTRWAQAGAIRVFVRSTGASLLWHEVLLYQQNQGWLCEWPCPHWTQKCQ